MLTTKEYMRVVSEIKPEWLVDIAPHYYSKKVEGGTAAHAGVAAVCLEAVPPPRPRPCPPQPDPRRPRPAARAARCAPQEIMEQAAKKLPKTLGKAAEAPAK